MAIPTRTSYFSRSDAYTASYQASYPATVPAGALVIWVACWRNNNTTPVACDDTSLTGITTLNTGTTNVYAGYKTADGTEGSDPITFSIPGPQNGPAVVCHVIEGWTGSLQAVYGESSADTSLTTMSVTGDDSLVLWHWHTDTNASAMASFDENNVSHDYTGWTFVDHVVGRDSSGSPVVVVFDREQASAGTTPTVSLDGATNGWTYILAINGETATAPVLSSPSSSSITQATATVSYSTTDATGTSYIVVTTSATPPSAAQIQAGDDHTDADAVFAASDASLESGANTFSVTGLTADTTYYYYVIQNDGSADSNIVDGTFATLSDSPTIETIQVVNAEADGFQLRFTTDTGNGTAYYVVYATGATDPSAAQILAETDGDDVAAIASDSMVISGTGVQTFPAVTGLNVGTTYRASIVHYGSVSS